MEVKTAKTITNEADNITILIGEIMRELTATKTIDKIIFVYALIAGNSNN